ncbi:MAG: 16S rRNA (guanine(966)-N(2))-methyltransferase RsmD [Actinomycetota bacterium]
MTRIVAGVARGRRLRVPRGRAIRPTTDRVREALFSSVESVLGAFAGLRVLDLYAGSGALGLEAVSRGAAYALLVESDPAAVRAIRENVAATGLGDVEVRPGAVERVLAAPPAAPFRLVLADPPYAMEAEELTRVLGLLTHGWLAADALVVVERSRRAAAVVWPSGLVGERQRNYGQTVLWYGRPAG